MTNMRKIINLVESKEIQLNEFNIPTEVKRKMNLKQQAAVEKLLKAFDDEGLEVYKIEELFEKINIELRNGDSFSVMTNGNGLAMDSDGEIDSLEEASEEEVERFIKGDKVEVQYDEEQEADDYTSLQEFMEDIEVGRIYDGFNYDGKMFTQTNYDQAGKEMIWTAEDGSDIYVKTPNRYEKDENGFIQVEEVYYQLEDGTVQEEVKGDIQETDFDEEEIEEAPSDMRSVINMVSEDESVQDEFSFERNEADKEADEYVNKEDREETPSEVKIESSNIYVTVGESESFDIPSDDKATQQQVSKYIQDAGYVTAEQFQEENGFDPYEDVEYVDGDNTYNNENDAPYTIDYNKSTHTNDETGEDDTVIRLGVHLGGDVRGNYDHYFKILSEEEIEDELNGESVTWDLFTPTLNVDIAFSDGSNLRLDSRGYDIFEGDFDGAMAESYWNEMKDLGPYEQREYLDKNGVKVYGY